MKRFLGVGEMVSSLHGFGVKSTDCSPAGLGFSSRHSHGSSKLSVTVVLFSGSHDPAFMWHTDNAGRIPINMQIIKLN